METHPQEKIEKRKEILEATVRVRGELDGSQACRVKNEVEKLRDLGARNIMVDLRGVTSFTLFGIGMLRTFLSNLEAEEEEIWIGGLAEKFKLLFKRFGYPRIES
jgi:anti-anti-sigma factor